MKLTQEKKAEIEWKLNNLNQLKDVLKSEFFGIDEVIDNLIHSIEPWYLFPESFFKPLVVNLWGMTGCGKTEVIRRIIEFLDFKKKYLYFDMGVAPSGSKFVFNHIFDDDLDYLAKYPAIICLDEFQHIRTINESKKEVDRNDIRKVWELIDTGKLEYNDFSKTSFILEIEQLIKYLQTAINSNVTIKNGIVKTAKKAYISIMNSGSEKYFFRTDSYFRNKPKMVDNSETIYFIPQNYYSDFYELVKNEFKSTMEFENHILSLDENQSIKFLKTIIQRKLEPTILDLSKSLIFIIGNLDEAYSMSHDLNPDNDPDILNKYSKEISLTDIKKELRKRFRQEQIARLGNNHLIYPAFTKDTFNRIISYNLQLFNKRTIEMFDLQIVFDSSVNEIIYKEGVFPTQGARPVLTTITRLIDSFLSKIMGELIKLEKTNIIKIYWRYDSGNFIIDAYDENNNNVKTLIYYVPLNIENLREIKIDDKQAMIAIHEAGHAVVSALLTRILPKEISSVSADSSIGGRVISDLPYDLITKKLMMANIQILLAGYLSERLIFGEENTTTGVSLDIARATDLAMDIIYSYGMGNNRYRICNKYKADDGTIANTEQHQEEIVKILKMCEIEAENILKRNKLLLMKVGEYLSLHSKMDRQMLKEYCMKYSNEGWAKAGGFIEKEKYYSFKDLLNEQLKEYSNWN